MDLTIPWADFRRLRGERESPREDAPARKRKARDAGKGAHACRGVVCPHVVNTGEALVCRLTGVCVGDVLMASYDFVSNSSLCKDKNYGRGASPDPGRADPPARQREPEESRVVPFAKTTAARGETEPSTVPEVVFGQCYRVVEKLFGEKGVTEEWKDAITRRCRDCYLVVCASSGAKSPATNPANAKGDYPHIAALYLFREGLTIKGTRVCERDETVAEKIPSLNELAKYGYQKSKYTKAYRALMAAIDDAQYKIPLHDLKF
jgi:hypothetical protein